MVEYKSVRITAATATEKIIRNEMSNRGFSSAHSQNELIFKAIRYWTINIPSLNRTEKALKERKNYEILVNSIKRFISLFETHQVNIIELSKIKDEKKITEIYLQCATITELIEREIKQIQCNELFENCGLN